MAGLQEDLSNKEHSLAVHQERVVTLEREASQARDDAAEWKRHAQAAKAALGEAEARLRVETKCTEDSKALVKRLRDEREEAESRLRKLRTQTQETMDQLRESARRRRTRFPSGSRSLNSLWRPRWWTL